MKLNSKRTYIIPTGLGFTFSFVTFLSFIIALTFGHPFSYFITFFSLSIIIVCAFETNSAIFRLKSFYFSDEFIECGSETDISFEISRHELKGVKGFNTRVEGQKTLKHSILSKKNTRVRATISKEKCGVFKSPRISIHTTYPLGLFKSWKYIEPSNSVIVYPSRVEKLDFQSRTNVLRGAENTVKENTQTKEEFLDHRVFRDTDSWKHIDWKAYARGRGLLTKNFSGNESSVMTLEVTSHSKLEYLGVITNELFNNYELSIKTIFMLDGEIVSEGSSPQHLHKCLRLLSLLGGSNE